MKSATPADECFPERAPEMFKLAEQHARERAKGTGGFRDTAFLKEGLRLFLFLVAVNIFFGIPDINFVGLAYLGNRFVFFHIGQAAVSRLFHCFRA